MKKMNRLATPQLTVLEDRSIAAADTANNYDIFTSPSGNADLTKAVLFRSGPCRIACKYGNADTAVFAILRRIPQGYSAPTITLVDGNTSFIDIDNILAYGVVRVSGSDTMARIDMRHLRRTVRLERGDKITLQVVSNAASAGQTYSALLEYSTV